MFYRTCFKKSCTWVYNKICAKYILDAVFCSYTWITHVTVCAQNEQEIPWSSQQQLAHNSCWEKQSFDRLLFLCLFGLFTPSYECICDRFHQRQCCDSRAGIFKWNFDHFLLETVWNGKESGVMCGSRTRLTCRILCNIYTGFKLVSLKSLNSQQFPPTICFIWWNATSHAVLCSCMWITYVKLYTVGLQWHKMNRKCPDQPSSSLLTTAIVEKQNSHRLLFVFFFDLFMPLYECICDRFECRQCCDSRAGIFKWNFDHFLWETGWNVKESRLMCGSRTRLTCSILINLFSINKFQVVLV